MVGPLPARPARGEAAHRRRLGDQSPDCLNIDDSFQPVVAQAESLAQYAWRFRYPGVPYEPEAEEASRALRKAEAVVVEVARRLPLVAGGDRGG